MFSANDRSIPVVLLGCALLVRPQCPTLPSGSCFVDCTRQEYRIVCEDVNGYNLNSDIMVYKDSSQYFQLFIWNSNAMSRLGSTILHFVKSQITALELDNLPNLNYFPEIKSLTRIERLRITNCPQLRDMPAELLPAQLTSIHLYATGINELINDFDEVEKIPGLRSFTFSKGLISYIQPGFFNLFPSMTTLRFTDTKFTTEIDLKAATDLEPLEELRFSRNTFVNTSDSTNRNALKNIVSIPMAINSTLDLSYNQLTLTGETLQALQNARHAKTLLLNGNLFEDYVVVSGIFQGFDHLVRLDLGETGMLKSSATFSGLPMLQELNISYNDFKDLTLVNLFSGLRATNLTSLDLSGNSLRLLPIGMEVFASTLMKLILKDNVLDIETIQSTDFAHSSFTMFTNLRELDLSRNKLKKFRGSSLRNMKRLETLNLACNGFKIVTKDFFTDLPASLLSLNLTFCASSESDAPIIDNDAFQTIPQIQTLILASGYLKSTIFQRFRTMDFPNLTELDLSENVISRIPSEPLNHGSLTALRTLRLRSNFFQSITPSEFQFFPALKQLDLSYNKILSIGANDFDGLLSLDTLDLSGNNIIQAQDGAFRNLVDLRRLYFGENTFTDIDNLFIGNNDPVLQHLGIQNLPTACLDLGVPQRLRRLKWIYLNHSLPLYLDFGSFRQIKDNIQNLPPRPVGFGEVAPEEMGCDDGTPYSTIVNDYFFYNGTNHYVTAAGNLGGPVLMYDCYGKPGVTDHLNQFRSGRRLTRLVFGVRSERKRGFKSSTDQERPKQVSLYRAHCFIRMMPGDKSNQVSQQLILNYPSCHVDAFRDVKNMVSSLICPG